MNRKEWYSTAGSAVRHFEDVEDDELEWTDRAYTFNTSCYSCHVSQLATNYEPENDSYHTVWAEPGVSCETCHGPAGEHVRTFRDLKPGETAPELGLVSVKSLTKEQRNDLCSSCHAKAGPLWPSFRPGDRFYDHFDLHTLESLDYHPDGRDLGENYTLTSWSMSPCVKSGELDCIHCHTSSGRFRFADRPNEACLPCHEERVQTVADHSHHPEGEGRRCINCHMPMTEFARMRRSDHSMRPPSPRASIELGSPNACTICHGDRSDQWADEAVRRWHGEGSGARLLQEGRLVAAARKEDWSRLPAMLEYLGAEGRDEIVTASLVRLLRACDDGTKWPVVRRLATDPSPLVRGAAVASLEDDPGGGDLLLAATRDHVRLVRIRAGAALGGLDPRTLSSSDRAGLEGALDELEQSLLARPDDFSSHYNLGNLHLERGDPAAAAGSYRSAVALRPDHVLAAPSPTSTWACCWPRGAGGATPPKPWSEHSSWTRRTPPPPTTSPFSSRQGTRARPQPLPTRRPRPPPQSRGTPGPRPSTSRRAGTRWMRPRLSRRSSPAIRATGTPGRSWGPCSKARAGTPRPARSTSVLPGPWDCPVPIAWASKLVPEAPRRGRPGLLTPG